MLRDVPPFGNFFSIQAGLFNASAARRAPGRRWIILLALLTLWIIAGYISWRHLGASEAAYRTIGALAMIDAYTSNEVLPFHVEAARFAGVAIPLIGVFFAFSGMLARSLAQVLNGWASNHVVIAGSSPAAISLTLDCLKNKDSVFLIARGLPEETQIQLGKEGCTLIDGDPTRIETLRTARAYAAAHVVAFEDDESANLQIEALMRRLIAKRGRRRDLIVHVATTTSNLLQETREMRAQEQKKVDEGKAVRVPIELRPFALQEIAARDFVQKHAPDILANAKALNQERPHIVFFGFDESAEAAAVRLLMSLWSAHFEQPRLTVFAPGGESAYQRFKARYPRAMLHPEIWSPDIAFEPFDWREWRARGPDDWHDGRIDRELLASINARRGPGSAIIVSTGDDAQNITVALALLRTCNQDLFWPVPIFMKQSAQSEFAEQYAKGDTTAEHDAYLQAFGASQAVATRANIIEGRLDVGAAIQHRHYEEKMVGRPGVSMQELEAMAKSWSNVRETYRDANRAGADAAMVRVWDAGWRAAAKHEYKAADQSPAIPDAMIEKMARREHERWTAERLLNGWRPGPKRDNVLRIHPNIAPWETLSDELKQRDVDQVRAAIDVARVMHPKGFMRSDVPPPPA